MCIDIDILVGQKVHLGFSIASCVKTLMSFLANPICATSSSHSSVSGQLGGFHVLSVVNSTAMNIGVHVSF